MANVQMRTESPNKSKGKTLEGSSTVDNRKKRLWTAVEDHILVDYVRQYGENSWADVQRITGLSRNGKSCRLRWTDQLHPGLNKEPFTLEEEMLIGDLQSQVGNKWSVISEFLPGRTDNAIKNYWYNRRKKFKMAGLPFDPVTSSKNSIYNGFLLNQRNLSPEWIASSEIPISRDSLSPLLHHVPPTYFLKPEPLELSSIQHDGFYLSSKPLEKLLSKIKPEGWLKEYVPPDFNSFSTASSCFMKEAYPLDMHQRDSSNPVPSNDLPTDCNDGLVDPIQTEGDLVDLWLKLCSLDELLNQEEEEEEEEGICADDGAIDNTNAAINKECIDSAEFPSWLNSPSLDEFLDQQTICQDTKSADDETINNSAASEEFTTCLNSTTMKDFQDQESISQALGCVNSGAKNEGLLEWCNSPTTREGFLNQESFCQDLVYYADSGSIDGFAAGNESNVLNYVWDETSDFWSTPFITEMQMDF